jgi:2-oxoisovalerate dehydrogenase E1 component
MVTPTHESTYHSDTRPDFAPFEESSGSIPGFSFDGSVASEIAAGRLTAEGALDLLDDLLAIRELEEMIVRLRSGGYDALPGYDYRGPTHVSIGQEGPQSARPQPCAPMTRSPAPTAATATR